jgi:hypothetical protein
MSLEVTMQQKTIALVAHDNSTADFLISSPLMRRAYVPAPTDFSAYMDRNLGTGK